MDGEIRSAAETKERKEIKVHTQVQLQLELFLMGSLISGPHSIVILSSSASFLAHGAEAAASIREKSIFCFLALFSALVSLLIYCGIFKLCSQISPNTSPFHFPGEAGVVSWAGSSSGVENLH